MVQQQPLLDVDFPERTTWSDPAKRASVRDQLLLSNTLILSWCENPFNSAKMTNARLNSLGSTHRTAMSLIRMNSINLTIHCLSTRFGGSSSQNHLPTTSKHSWKSAKSSFNYRGHFVAPTTSPGNHAPCQTFVIAGSTTSFRLRISCTS